MGHQQAFAVMPGLVPGIHAVGPSVGVAGGIRLSVQYFAAFVQPNRVDGRDKPGHDGEGGGDASLALKLAPMGQRPRLQAPYHP